MSIVWLASYPKSGNTWVRLALQSLARGGVALQLNDQDERAGLAASRDLLEGILGVDTSELSADEIEELRPRCYEVIAREASSPVLMKVHDAWTSTPAGEPLFPLSATAAAIYIARDPRDVATSYASHLGVPVDTIIEWMGDPDYAVDAGSRALPGQVRQRYLSWSAHVESWIDAPGLRLLQVRYEDMVRDFPAELARIAAFAGIAATAEAIAGATAATRFEVLQAAEAAQGFADRHPASERFFRKGVAGGWRNELTSEQSRKIEHRQSAVMRRLKYLNCQ